MKLVVVLSMIALYSKLTESTLDLSSERSGKATYYGGNPGGNACGYSHVPSKSFPYGYYAAAGNDIFSGGYGCGKCYEITCIGPLDASNKKCVCDRNTPSVIVQVMDECQECSGNPSAHFDLNPKAMARIVGKGLSGLCGRIKLRYKRVTCGYTGNIKIRSKSGTSKYWWGGHIDDVAGFGSIAQFKIRNNGDNTWYPLFKNEGPSFWKLSGGYPLSFPLDVQLIDEENNKLTFKNCIKNKNENTEFDCGSNYSDDMI